MATVTCRTEGCGNANIPLDLPLIWEDPDTGESMPLDAVMCGVCGQEITDITDDERTEAHDPT